MIWKAIFGANGRKVEAVAHWMAQALVDAALRDSRGPNFDAEPQGMQRAQRKIAKAGRNGAQAARSG